MRKHSIYSENCFDFQSLGNFEALFKISLGLRGGFLAAEVWHLFIHKPVFICILQRKVRSEAFNKVSILGYRQAV